MPRRIGEVPFLLHSPIPYNPALRRCMQYATSANVTGVSDACDPRFSGHTPSPSPRIKSFGITRFGDLTREERVLEGSINIFNWTAPFKNE